MLLLIIDIIILQKQVLLEDVTDEPNDQTDAHPHAELATPLTTAPQVGALHNSRAMNQTGEASSHTVLPAPGRPKEIMTAQNFFRNFDIKKAVDLMVECWNFVNAATVKHGWRRVFPWIEAETSSGARELSTTQERQSVAAAMGSLLQLAKTLPISGYDIVSAAGIENLIGERVAGPSAEDMLEEENEEEEKKRKRKMKMSQLFTN
ncbi:uncharacterized protein LOC123508986 isoform X2 [Portunus trituberculatus]|uniref:uncharacterized protein LOC123508986 isoform X2 n=1 Tax=Portunus trituberculatus TaxID=210409 RepID=UPI001E1CCF2F|nr:uncharacterized protein LOC123508986 isoform X2 [Portunus trituberculatus]